MNKNELEQQIARLYKAAHRASGRLFTAYVCEIAKLEILKEMYA